MPRGGSSSPVLESAVLDFLLMVNTAWQAHASSPPLTAGAAAAASRRSRRRARHAADALAAGAAAASCLRQPDESDDAAAAASWRLVTAVLLYTSWMPSITTSHMFTWKESASLDIHNK